MALKGINNGKRLHLLEGGKLFPYISLLCFHVFIHFYLAYKLWYVYSSSAGNGYYSIQFIILKKNHLFHMTLKHIQICIDIVYITNTMEGSRCRSITSINYLQQIAWVDPFSPCLTVPILLQKHILYSTNP